MEKPRIATLKNIEAEKIIEIDAQKTVEVKCETIYLQKDGTATCGASTASYGQFKNKAISLSANFDWVIALDTLGQPLLIPLIKD